MFRVKPAVINSRHNDLLLIGLFLRRLPISQGFELCHTAVGQLKEESAARNLPCLPVQPLEQMIDKYIKSIKPFVNSYELEKTKELAKAFCEDKNVGKKLQGLLEERAKSMDNWLADWWLQTAYLEYRDPVPIFSSPALVWPEKEFKNDQEQLTYAAHLIKLALDFNRLIETGKIPQDKLGGHLLCMNQYGKIFGTCRIPKMPRDELSFQDSQNPSTNIIVMYNNHLFNVRAFRNDKEREPFAASQFYTTLSDVVAEGSGESGLPVGVLTSQHRDNWARNYEELKKDPKNKRILEEYLEKALFVLCLDKPAPSGCDGFTYGARCSKLLLHGFGFRGNAGNRWYDKTIQFVVGAGADGVGIVYEHSPAEGGPIAVLTDFIHSFMGKETLSSSPEYPKPERLDFVFSDSIKGSILTAGAAIDRLSDDLEVSGWSFSAFGKEQLKRLKVSPDSFIQIAIQLAFYKLHGRAAAQYESGSLRRFVRGRTDTIRTCSEEVVDFCEKSADPRATPTEVSTALRRALDSHKTYARDVLEGRGVDRHLLGLKILAKMNDLENRVPIFSGPAYERSSHFQLSTSNVPTNCDAFMVYGPLVHDGYACCYNPRKNSINFGISAWSSSNFTDLNEFKKKLEEALLSMSQCLLLDPPVASKL